MYRNKEGYVDSTAGSALSHMMKEYRQKQKKHYADNAGDAAANTAAAIGYCRRVIQDGYMPIASHLLYPQILNDNNPAERELGLSFGLALLQMCDEVWVFGKVSKGMTSEIEEAKRLKKQIRYFEEVNV